MRSIEQLTEKILSLPSISRAILADKLVESLEFDIDPTIQKTLIAEVMKRQDEVQSCSVKVVLGDEALSQVILLIKQ